MLDLTQCELGVKNLNRYLALCRTDTSKSVTVEPQEELVCDGATFNALSDPNLDFKVLLFNVK